MASGRFLSAAIGEDFRLNSLSLEAHLVFLMAIPHLDVDGIMPGHPTLVHARACPLKSELRDKMAAIIDEWVSAGLVVRYDSNGEEALFFTGFPKNQRVRRDREAGSRFATPPGWMRDDNGGLTPGQLRESSGSNERISPPHSTAGVLPDNSGSTPGVLHPNTIQYNTTTTTTCAGAHPDDSSSRSSNSEPSETAVINAWGDNEMAGTPKGATLKTLQGLIAEHGSRQVVAAISIAGEQDRRTMAYVKGVLRQGINSRASPGANGAYAGMTLVPDEGGDDDD